MNKRIRIATLLMRMLCAIAILSLGLAHKPPQVMAAAIGTAALVLPDGTYADICVSHSAIKHPSATLYCEACMLAGSTLLPQPDTDGWLLSSFPSLYNGQKAVVAHLVQKAVERPHSRAPPIVS
ncbi:hypothetical protein NBH20_11100 [Rhizobium sp. S153]|uniref:DUF2946 domain-containing protein n=1 Tax=Ciceribacter sichuanensis TaxID=2949647 RepID=A0ABT0V765_9HYPH|nr:hypothetical protein [Ciceribacter sp. S153]MCM2401706.1 hypothetical protein [Ciceribacter sp. S153]